MPLTQEFFSRPTLKVARELLGVRLMRLDEGGLLLSGVITETEAYIGEDDLGCHARAGQTARTRVMYGPPGRAYVYFTYGMHWMLNVVTQGMGYPAAVLIRALRVENGQALVAARRTGISAQHWTDGPAKLARAFAIDGSFNGVDLTDPVSGLWLEPGNNIPEENVTIGPRVGLYTVPEPWKSMPWRFCVNK